MSCNVEKYLIEQQVACVRIARTCHDDDRIEWDKCAEVIEKRRMEHENSCPRCVGKDWK
jgi:hypothetical protein